MRRFLTWLSRVWSAILVEPDHFPGHSLQEKLLMMIDGQIAGSGAHLRIKQEFSPTHGLRFFIAAVPVGVEIPTDFDIRLLFST